jgi:putative hydrolase of the HAD superfamily
MAIKAIIFDCFGVLLDSPGYVELQKDYPQFEEQIDDLDRQSDYGMISFRKYDNSVSELTGLPPKEVESRYLHYDVRNESAIAWVRQLKRQNKYKIGLLSNIGRGFLDDFLPETERSILFDAVVLSRDIGMVKPDPRIFEFMADKLNVSPFECIVIDDMPSNIDGAEHADMQGILYKSIHQAQAELKQLLKSTHA